MLDCEVCNERPGVCVAAVPGLPYSASYCKECLQARANPYWCLTLNTAMAGGIEHCNAEWKQIVQVTLDYLNKDWTEFDKDVTKSIQKMEED